MVEESLYHFSIAFKSNLKKTIMKKITTLLLVFIFSSTALFAQTYTTPDTGVDWT